MIPVYTTDIRFVFNSPCLLILTKRCNTCLEDLPLNAFSFDTTTDGYAGRCKQCRSAKYQALPEEEKDHIRKQDRESRLPRIEQRRAYDRKRRPRKTPIVQLPLIVFFRTCLTCKKEKPIEDFDKQATGKFGYRAHCKECRAYQRQVTPPRQSWVIVDCKVCPRCSIEKPIEDFTLSKRRRDGHCGWCKQCVSKIVHSEETKTRKQAREKLRRLNPEYRKKIKEAYVRRMLNPEYREKLRQKAHEWNKSHLHILRDGNHRRRARERMTYISKINYARLLQSYGTWCYICEKAILPEQRTEFDHVVPISRGGPHTESNIRPVHRICNRRKFNRFLNEMSPLDRRGVS